MSGKKDDIELKIKKIAIGLRHRRSFGIPEITGTMIDHVVNDKKSPFTSEKFNRTDSIIEFGESKGRILLGEKNENSLLVDVDNVVLTIDGNDEDNIKNILKDIKENYIPYITKNIHKQFEISNFNRLGIVYEYDIVGKPDRFVSRLTGGTFSNGQMGIFKFAAKEADEKSMFMQKVLDYKNYLVSITFSGLEPRAKFDYQFYFRPEIKSVGDIDFDSFIEESEKRLEEKFIRWLKNEEKA